MLAWKLFRVLKDGSITSLFINKSVKLSCDVWYLAEEHKTKGFAFRLGWHVTAKPEAPHLSTKNRVWKQVEIQDFETLSRPVSQGGTWYLAKKLRILPD